MDWFDDAGWAIIVDHWRAAARVPKGAGRLVLLLGADAQQTENDVVWWDDALVVKVD